MHFTDTGKPRKDWETPPSSSAQQPQEMGVKHFSQLFSKWHIFCAINLELRRSSNGFGCVLTCSVCTKTLSRESQPWWIFAPDKYPVKHPRWQQPCWPPTLRSGWNASDGLCFPSPSWPSWPGLAVMVKKRRWGDCPPFSSEAQLKNSSAHSSAVAHALPHHSNQSVKLYNQMFPRGNFGKLKLRSNRGLPGWCVPVHMCWCLHCYAAFFQCSQTQQASWGRGICFLDSCLFSISHSLEPLLPTHRSQVPSPPAEALGSHQHSEHGSIIGFFLHPSFPRSSATSLRPLCWDLLTSNPSMCYDSSSLARKWKKCVNIPQRWFPH